MTTLLTRSSKNDAGSEDLIREIYCGGFCHHREAVGYLDCVGYLEKVLWVRLSCCGALVSRVLALSIVALVNEMARCGHLSETLARLLRLFEPTEKYKLSPFSNLLRATCILATDRNCALIELESILHFLVHVYMRLEHTPIRRAALRLVGLSLWEQLSEHRRSLELRKFPQLLRHWQHHLSKQKKGGALDTFFPSLMDTMVCLLESGINSEAHEWSRRCISRFLELSTDLLLQLPTRRFLYAVLHDARIYEHMMLLRFVKAEHCIARLLPLLSAFGAAMNFGIVNQTGQALKHGEELAERYARLYSFQCACYQVNPNDVFCHRIAFASTAQLATPQTLRAVLACTPMKILVQAACDTLHVLPCDKALHHPELLLEVAANDLCCRTDALEAVNKEHLYPSEATLWAEDAHCTDWPLALPKLNLQFLAFQDYLLRCFSLYHIESAHEVRADICEAIRRLQPRIDKTGSTRFTGWSRFATPCVCSVSKIRKPNLGMSHPAEVLCNITVELIDFGETGAPLRDEWEQLREHDVVFLLSVNGSTYSQWDNLLAGGSFSLAKEHVHLVRGGQIVQVGTDTVGCFAHTRSIPSLKQHGTDCSGKRNIVIRMDPAQYQEDVHASVNPPYSAINIVLRRDARANNFYRVLETIRDLIHTEAFESVVPAWLRDVLLGYGDAGMAHYSQLRDRLNAFDAIDTFHDLDHVAMSFPELRLDASVNAFLRPKATRMFFQLSLDHTERSVIASPYPHDSITYYRSPALAAENTPIFEARSCNPTRFTPLQVEAICGGMNSGLTLIVGPPGTGKTDVAVQIVANLHHNFPDERTLLVAHSNAALNDLFEKILERNVPARHLVRLGSGERDLKVDASFSQVGRVDATLARRLTLLDEVQRLAASLQNDCKYCPVGTNIGEASGYTCETAGHFERTYINICIDTFELGLRALGSTTTVAAIQTAFPFSDFFEKDTITKSGDLAKSAIFGTCQTSEEAVIVANTCIRYIKSIFLELQEYRAFELLRSQKQRMDYLLTKQARIVAMTCTRAALVRRDLVDLGFAYDTIIVEEAAQMLEIETFIPLMLQPCGWDNPRLKRVVFIGDHRQLPPVVKNHALAHHAMLDQSLFARLIRLGVPAIHLDKQGRSRPKIAKLYNWRYNSLGDLDLVEHGAYRLANPGFSFVYQFVDVADFQGRGEHCPTAHFFQNLGEAEYVVAVYMYMRLLGYPARCITILTTYNGQKALVKDILTQRCADDLRYGLPYVTDTVDKYQGSQNDFILLSLVRTRHVGHLRDVRRIIVAMSRARLGLYVFGRVSTFLACNDLKATMATFLEMPTTLVLAFGDILHGQTNCRLQDNFSRSSVHIDGPCDMSALVDHFARYSVAL